MTTRKYLEDQDAEEPDDFIISLISLVSITLLFNLVCVCRYHLIGVQWHPHVILCKIFWALQQLELSLFCELIVSSNAECKINWKKICYSSDSVLIVNVCCVVFMICSFNFTCFLIKAHIYALYPVGYDLSLHESSWLSCLQILWRIEKPKRSVVYYRIQTSRKNFMFSVCFCYNHTANFRIDLFVMWKYHRNPKINLSDFLFLFWLSWSFFDR